MEEFFIILALLGVKGKLRQAEPYLAKPGDNMCILFESKLHCPSYSSQYKLFYISYGQITAARYYHADVILSRLCDTMYHSDVILNFNQVFDTEKNVCEMCSLQQCVILKIVFSFEN